jgi:hypothetical protein
MNAKNTIIMFTLVILIVAVSVIAIKFQIHFHTSWIWGGIALFFLIRRQMKRGGRI